MRRIERTNAFRRDFKREKRGQHRRDLENLVAFAVSLLADDKPLPEKNRDHALAGEWSDHRECHLKPDLLLIYRKEDAEVLQLVRTASYLISHAPKIRVQLGSPETCRNRRFNRGPVAPASARTDKIKIPYG